MTEMLALASARAGHITEQAAGAVVVVGGTSGLGRDLAQHYADHGRPVVITGRERERAAKVAAEIGGDTHGIAVDLADPAGIGPALADIGPVAYLALTAFHRDQNTAADFQLESGRTAITVKLVGYAEVVHALLDRLARDGAILLYGGGLKDRPMVGSLTTSTANAGVDGLVRALAIELAPIRANAIHPGMVADSPHWSTRPDEVREGIRARTPTGRYVTMREVTEAAVLLLENPAVNGTGLMISGGLHLT